MDIFGLAVMFKSYYVVWKPSVEREEKQRPKKFKSYYVVWKQKNTADEKEIIESLNRTM